MSEPSFPFLTLKWRDVEYQCAATFNVVRQIEQNVKLGEVADAALNNPNAIKQTDLVWLVYCFLVGAGVELTPDEVFAEVRASNIGEKEIVSVVLFAVNEVFGVGPESAPK